MQKRHVSRIFDAIAVATIQIHAHTPAVLIHCYSIRNANWIKWHWLTFLGSIWIWMLTWFCWHLLVGWDNFQDVNGNFSFWYESNMSGIQAENWKIRSQASQYCLVLARTSELTQSWKGVGKRPRLNNCFNLSCHIYRIWISTTRNQNLFGFRLNDMCLINSALFWTKNEWILWL